MNIKSIKFAIRIYWKEIFGDDPFVPIVIGTAIAATILGVILYRLYGHPFDYILVGLGLLGLVYAKWGKY